MSKFKRILAKEHLKIAKRCSEAAAKTQSKGDHDQLMQMHREHLELAEQDGSSEPIWKRTFH